MICAALWQTCTMFISGRCVTSQIPRFVGPTWGPPGSCRPQMGPMLAPWTLLSGIPSMRYVAWCHSRDYYLYLVTPHLCQIFGIHLMNVLWVPNLQMSYSDLIKWLETRTRVLSIRALQALHHDICYYGDRVRWWFTWQMRLWVFLDGKAAMENNITVCIPTPSGVYTAQRIVMETTVSMKDCAARLEIL